MSGYTRTAGERIGPYVLEAPLGRGGFSEVWRARTPEGTIPPAVALKVLIHPEHVAQLRAEASALSVAKGHGILVVHGVDLTADPPYIALELADGDLRAAMVRENGRLEPTQAVLRQEQVLEILARVHREGIVHGDLKPENVLLKGRDVMLADFGLSRRLSQRSASLSVSLSREDARLAGTLDYMAPEQREGEKPTPRSDVYAMGVLLYEMLTGERPQGVFGLPSEKDPRIPPVLDRLLACSLAHDPRHRFATAGAMLAFLRQGLKNDWSELAKAHRRVEMILRGLRANDATTLLVLFGAIILAVVFAVIGAEATLGRRELAHHSGFLDRVFLGSCVAIPAALFALSLLVLRPWLERRESRLARLRSKITRQIASRPAWQNRTRPAAGRRDPLHDQVKIRREL